MPKTPKPEGVEASPRGKKPTATKAPRTSYDDASAAVKNLSDRTPTALHFERYREEANAERADRGAAILLAANLENALEYAITRQLRIRSAMRRELFRFGGALGSFSNKITVGQTIGIFGPVFRKNFDIIRTIRNAFAHSKIPVNFDDEPIRALCLFLKVPSEIDIGAKRWVAPPISPGLSRYRHVYQTTCTGMELSLVARDFAGPVPIGVGAIDPRVRESLGPATEILAVSPPLP